MNKLTKMMIGTTITALLLTATVTAFAQDSYGEPGRKGQHHQRGPQANPLVGQMMRGLRQLDLTDAQEESIKTVMQGLKAETRPIMQEMKAGHLQLKELIKADSYDEKAVAALAEKEGEMAARRLQIAGRAMSEVFSLLTDEQRAELDAMAAERQEKRTQRREQRSDQS